MPKPAINFQILRHIAESASGYRYRDTWFVVFHDPVTGLVVKPQHTAPEVDDPDTTVIFCEKVDYHQPPEVTTANIGTRDITIDLLDIHVDVTEQMDPPSVQPADAVFWSVSAVEKFLSPYYASVYGDDGGRMVESLLRVLRPQVPEAVGDGTVVLEEPDQAFAIVHIPNSEYIGVGEVPETILPGMASLHRSGAARRITAARPGYGAEAPAQNSGSRAM